MTKPTGRPNGRPPKLDQVVDRRGDGTPVTAAEKVLEMTRTVWAPWDICAKAAGISTATLTTWRREGGLARGKIARGQKVNANERRYAEFLSDLEKAEAEAVRSRLAKIEEVGKGGWTRTKTVEKVIVRDGEETVVERTTTTETADPVWTAEAWLLERRRPLDFGRTRVEVTGAGGAPLLPKEDRVAALTEALEAYQTGVADGAKRAKEETTDAT